ncbi:MAG: HflK protein, partial [Deltaproteobacteria bacterium]|nr:HflK protein [Deltaproteobacteria bacterium]
MAWETRGRRHVEPELPDFGDIGPKLKHWLKKWWAVPVGIVVVIWLATGIYTVGPGSQGVVKQFGQEIGKTSAGLNYHLPGPFQTVTVVDLASVRRLNIGFEEVKPGQFREIPNQALMLTKDENIVNVHVIVQYRVLDASQFLFKVRDVPGVLRTATEVALSSTVGNT